MYNPYQTQFSMYQNTPMQQSILPQQQIMQSNGKPTFDTFRMSPNSSILNEEKYMMLPKCYTNPLKS